MSPLGWLKPEGGELAMYSLAYFTRLFRYLCIEPCRTLKLLNLLLHQPNKGITRCLLDHYPSLLPADDICFGVILNKLVCLHRVAGRM